MPQEELLHPSPVSHISFGVSIERHSKGTNFSIRIDNASSEDELMERAKVLWDKLEYRFGSGGSPNEVR